ncbi:type II toxin-antitoxin system RelB/DinJ family antitoxin [Candidatus Gottesmanbacteria bacterium]|nr:type II toxin-antitoxin system RelB/DinJ family antitoxin [Candidatus Gottesmanbacteria bacterium]
MNSAVINIKTEPEVKQKAQKLAKDLGLNLSALINGYLRQLIKTKRVEFSLDETPSEYLKQAIKQAQKERKEGKASPVFDKASDAIKWLHEHS